MNVETERQELLDQIKQHIDPRYQAGMATAVPTGLKMYGVRVPQLREMARLWQRAHKAVARANPARKRCWLCICSSTTNAGSPS